MQPNKRGLLRETPVISQDINILLKLQIGVNKLISLSRVKLNQTSGHECSKLLWACSSYHKHPSSLDERSAERNGKHL